MARMCLLLSSKFQLGKMRKQKVFSRFLLLYNIIKTFCTVVQAGEDHSQGFIHMDDDLRYLLEDGPLKMHEFYPNEDTSAVSFSDLNEDNLNTYASPIAFYPLMLNFHSHPVGIPKMERVSVQNLSPDTTIHMLSISGNTLHTHCSFFQEKVILPGMNTSFEVVLLPREEGPIEDTLFIHTSLGSFKFQVSAVGISNPYRLKPFVGVRMPLNSSYTPLIYMHNPHSTTIQVTELYSSGGDLHLELPNSEIEASKSLWEIPPYETKAVIKANFIARVEKNHTAYICIRTNVSGEDYILLPVQVDVTSAPGIYSTSEMLDFGILRSEDPPKSLTLSLLNSGQKHVHIMNVIATPVNEAIDIKFTPLKMPPETVFSSEIATITFNPSKVLHTKQCSGKIVVKSKNNQYKLQIPYQAQFTHGSLDYNENSTRFYMSTQNASTLRDFNVTSYFNSIIIIDNISLPDEAKKHFSINMTKPAILQPGVSTTVASILFKPSSPDLLNFNTYLRLHTNISQFDIPLLCYKGYLKVFFPNAVNESFIDFGMLGIGDKRTLEFAVINENPVDVNLKFWGSNSSKTYIELVGVDEGNVSTLAWRQNFSAMARSLILKPQHYAIFRIGITAPKYEGVFQSHAVIETQYEKLNIAFTLRTAKGALKVDEIFFENCFPGRISVQNLHIHSSFSHPMTVTGISTVPNDPRFIFDPLKQGLPVLTPNSRTLVGKIFFDHRRSCKQKCYCGLPTTTSMGHQWLFGMALPSDIGKMDGELFRMLLRRWHSLIDLEERITNITLKIDTTEVRGYLMKAHALFQWPRVVVQHRLNFPITHIGNYSIKDFILENPSSLPVIIQVVPLSLYPNPENILSVLRERYGEEYDAANIIKDSEVFSLEDLSDNLSPTQLSHVPAYRKSLEEFFGIESHKKTIAILLTPGMRVRVQVKFSPEEDTRKSSLFLIRNNLTVIDALLVQGQGGYGNIKFGNKTPGNDSVLLFELTERVLKDCDGSKTSKYSPPNFTVRRSFTIRNTGALPLYITNFDINGEFCEGFGFKVHTCQGFELKPNASQNINIVYTPDFSLTHVERTLNIHTNQRTKGQTFQYKIVVNVPRHLLDSCFNAVPRPEWEHYVYFISVGFSVMTYFTVIICGYLDGRHILHTTFFPFVTIKTQAEKMETEKVFDLNALCHESNSHSSTTVSHTDMKKEKDISEKIPIANNPVKPAVKTSEPRLKKNEVQTSTDHENNNIDMSRHPSKKRSSKRLNNENMNSEMNLINFKKSQSRNSWTRFLKPQFSFQSCSNLNNKPSVATQTIINSMEDTLNSLKEVDMEEQNMNSFRHIDQLNYRINNKNDNRINDCINKLNDISPEEETSSTTTETSTESDMSEKSNPLRRTSFDAESRKTSSYCKGKNKNTSTSSNPKTRQSSKSVDKEPEFEQFQLAKIGKTNYRLRTPTRKISADGFEASSLELPYKPKASEDPDMEIELLLASGQSSPKTNNLEKTERVEKNPQNGAVTKETITNINKETLPTTSQKKSSEHNKPSSPAEPSILPNRTSNCGVASNDDVILNNERLGFPQCQAPRCQSVPVKPVNTYNYQSCLNCNVLPKKSNEPLFPPTSCWSVESPPKADSLLGSKLNNWLLLNPESSSSTSMPSSSESGSSVFEISNQRKGSADWPGFNVNNLMESFWDPNYNPSGDSWSSNVSPSIQPDNVWGSPLPSFKPDCSPLPSSSVWKTDSAWSSNCDNFTSTKDPSPISKLVINPGTLLQEKKYSETDEFNPFHTPSALWMSPLIKTEGSIPTLTDPSTSSFSFFSSLPHPDDTFPTPKEPGTNSVDHSIFKS